MAQPAPIDAARPFGQLPDGTPVSSIALISDAFEVEIVTLGATLRGLAHEGTQLLLAPRDLAGYLGNHPYLGSTVGPVAGRIAGGLAEIDGGELRLPLNDPPERPVSHLHGGPDNWTGRVWHLDHHDATTARLSLEVPDGAGHYPGPVRAVVTYRLDDAGLAIDYEATTQRPTLVGPTNHAYFNLAGHDARTIDDHVVRVHAWAFAEADDLYRLTPARVPVDGRAEDLREPAPLGERMPDWLGRHGSMYFIDGEPGTLRPAADVTCERAGRRLGVSTTEACLQLYTGVMLDVAAGRDGRRYGPHAGFCVEAQAFPEAARPGLRGDLGKLVLRPGETYRQSTRYDVARTR